MTTRAQIVAEARRWVGAPVIHQGRTRAGGVDCLGLIMAVGQATGAIGDVAEPAYYGRLPNSHRLVADMNAAMLPLARTVAGDYTAGDLVDRDAAADELGDGDVVGLSWGKALHPMHLAICATFDGRRTIVHAYPQERRVVEVTMGAIWAHRACAAWRFPNLTNGV